MIDHSGIGDLTPDQRAHLERLLSSKLPTASRRAAITPRPAAALTPLTHAQQREWALEQFRPANNIAGALSLHGRVDLDLLSRILTQVLERHEVLRSTVTIRDGRPIQVVHPATPVPVPVEDLSHLAPDEKEHAVRSRYLAETARRFAPEETQRMRIILLRTAPERHIALLTTHHGSSDGWSVAILVRDLTELYRAAVNGTEPNLPRLPIQFGDYAVWQRTIHNDKWMEDQIEAWRSELQGVPTELALPADRPFPAHPTFAGRHLVRVIDAEKTRTIHRAIKDLGISTSMMLLGTAAVFLYATSGQSDMLFGSAVTGRYRPETEQLIGCFTNIVPLRVRMSDTDTITDLMHRCAEVASRAFTRSDVPFGQLVESVSMHSAGAPTPLVQMVINILTTPGETLRSTKTTLEVPGLRITPEPVDPGHVAVDLSLNVEPRPDSIIVQWHYSTERFNTSTVERIAQIYEQLLATLAADPTALVRTFHPDYESDVR